MNVPLRNMRERKMEIREMPQVPEKELYTTEDVARMFLCSPSKINHDAYKGLITPVKIRPMVFTRAAIEEYKEKGMEFQRKRIAERMARKNEKNQKID